MPSTLYYFPIRGRGEPIRLALAAAGVKWTEEVPEWQSMKADKVGYPFGQLPRFKDDTVDMVQSNSILRHLGRKYGLDGATEQEKVLVDMAMETVESIRLKYVALIYQDQLAPEKLQAFINTHVSKENANGRNGGAHVSYLDWLVTRGSFGVAENLTVGDLDVWDILDTLLRIIPSIAEEYPALKAFHTKVSELPRIKDYLACPLRPTRPNNNNLG